MSKSTELRAFRDRIIPAVIEEVTREQGWDTLRKETLKKRIGLQTEPVWEARIPVIKTMVRTMAIETGNKQDVLDRLKAAKPETHAAYAMNEKYEAGEPELVDVLADVQPEPEASTDDPVVYKKMVRRLAIEEASNRGWCDSGLNKYLEKLGLAPKVPVYVRVTTLVEQGYSILVPDAESREEAREMLAADDKRVRELLKSQVGGNYVFRDVEVPELPDPSTQPVVGEIDALYWRFGDQGGSTPRCNQYGRYSDYQCTRVFGHDGHHAKHVQHEGTVKVTWAGPDTPYAAQQGQTADSVI